MFLIFHFITRIMSACPYTSFNQSQLRSDNFFQEQTYIRGNPYAFGVWTQYAPIRQNQYSNYTKSLFNQEGNLDGVHILNFQSDNKIQTLYYQKWIYLTGYPSLVILQRTYDTIYKYSIQQSNYTYEGYWIFTYFSFKYDNQYNIALYNTGDNSFINVLATNRKLTTQTTNAKLEYGGQGQYKIGSSNYNLNIFPGRISIITIFENDIQFFNNNDKSKFYSFLSTCQIPSPCQQEYNIFFQTEPSSFENCTALQFNLEIPVVRFMFDLWIKRDMDILNSQKEIILSMGGQYLNRYTFYQMQILWRNVDKLVNLMHDMQLFTVVPSEITQENNQLKQITYLNQQKYQMDKWIYLSYEFQKIQNYSYVHLSIYQSCCDSWRKFKILETFNQSQYSNYKVKFTLFQGQFNMPNYIPFAGLISNFRVKFCYQGDLNFGKQYNLNCNAQCKTCKGPTKYDCTSCYDEQNRYFESEVQLCLCKRDFDETGSLICKKNFLSSILNGNNIQQEFLIQEFQLNQKCMFGYFEFWKNLTFIGCIQCPYFGQNQQSIRCVNCLLNSKTWYKLPICDLEYQSLDSVFYFDQKLDYITKELFIVNQELMVVELCKGCEQMVQQKSSRSVMINIDGSISIYQCKSFLYSKNDSCELCDTNCKICNDQGQCIQCFEGFYLKQNVCQKCPQECGLCEYNMENEILKCLSCQINYGLVDNQCIKCGYLCEICERRKYNFQEQEYLKCLKCYRNTFISLDGESCYYNKMSDCISPFQFKINSPWLNTLLHNFTPLEQNQIQTGCTQCTPIFYLETYENKFECIAIPKDTTTYGGCILLAKVDKDKFVCHVGIKNQMGSSNYAYCSQKIPYCLACYYSNWEIKNFCMLCQDGYYNHYQTTYCFPCPLGCLKCIQTDSSNIVKSTSRKTDTILNRVGLINYERHTINPDLSYVSIKCTKCLDGQVLYLDKCIQPCPNNCKKCKIQNYQQVCISCITYKDSNYQVFEGKCIQCPSNCKLCYPRIKEEKESINPFFNNNDLDYFSHKCIFPLTNKSFYDQSINQFINCENFVSECEKQLTIDIYLYCNQIDLNNYINSLTQEQQIIQSKYHLLFENLDLSKQYEYFDYSLYLNQNFVKKLTYQIKFAKDQICSIDKDLLIYSNLQKNCFNLNQLYLVIDGSNNTLHLNNLFQIQNFTHVAIRNVKFQINQGSVKISSLTNYTVKFENITIYQDLGQKYMNDYMISILEASQIFILHFSIKQIYATNQAGLFYIKNQNLDLKMFATNIILQQTNFNGSICFNIIATKQIELQLDQVLVSESLFQLSQYLQVSSDNINLKLQNCVFKNLAIINAVGFLNFTFAKSTNLKGIEIINSSFKNSIFISCSKIFFLNNFNIEQLEILEESTILTNQFAQNAESIRIQNGQFIDNTYTNNYSFMQFLSFECQNCTIVFANLNLSKNSIDQSQKDKFINRVDICLIFVQATTVIFDNLIISRGIGYIEFTITNTDTFKFLNSNVSLHQNYQFQSLFNQLECNISKYNKYMYGTLFNLQEISNIYLQNINISNLILYDSVLFEIQVISQLESKFHMLKCNISSNIIHQINSYLLTSLISIKAPKYLDLNWTSVIYSKNLLNLLTKSRPNQNSLIKIEATSSLITLQNCIIEKNINLNGLGSIMNIQSDQIFLQNVVFLDNSALSYDTLKQFIRWGLNGTIYQEDLKEIYHINSQGGNGNFQGRIIILKNVHLEGSISKQGAGFMLNMLEKGNLTIINSTFINLKTELSEFSKGGAFYISTQSEYLNIQVINTKFQDIYARKAGSVFYIQPSSKIFQFLIINSTFENIFSLQGGLIYVEQSIHQNLEINFINCQLSQLIDKFYLFLNSLPGLLNIQLNQLSQEHSIIFCYDCSIQIVDFSLKNYPPIPLFQFIGNIKLINITIENVQFSNQLFVFSQIKSSDSVSINILKLKNCTLMTIENIVVPEIQYAKKYIQNLKTVCSEQLINPPETLYSFASITSNNNQIVLLEILLNQAQKSIKTIIKFTEFLYDYRIRLYHIYLQDIKCSNCQNGLMTFEIGLTSSVNIELMSILNCYCGEKGCVNFINSQNTRLLKSLTDQSIFYSDNTSNRISQFLCKENHALFGGCLYISNHNVFILNSLISNNKATYGGGIYINGNSSILYANDLKIINNTAQYGSGIYTNGNLKRNIDSIELINNYGSNQIEEYPQNFNLRIYNNQVLIPTIVQNQNYLYQAEFIKQNRERIIIKVPTGILLTQYQQFDLQNNLFKKQNVKLQLIAINSQSEIVKQLTNTYCELQIHNLNRDSKFQANLRLSKDKVYFNQQTSSYNLEELIFYLPQDITQTYELSIWCNSIQVPIVNYQSKFIEGYHQNFKLKLFLQPVQCQLGEYNVNREDYCHQCNISKREYSVTVGATYCQIVDDEKIQDFNQAQLSLKAGYWRLKVTSSVIDLCFNRQENCLGGWGVGDELCQQGFIGALCEQCDYYNIKGGGYFQRYHNFECNTCGQFQYQQIINLISIIFIFGALILIFNYFAEVRSQKIRQNIHLLKDPFKSFCFRFKEIQIIQSIKTFLQYIQILSLTQELHSSFSEGITLINNYLGNPFALLAIYEECQLLDLGINLVYIQIFQNLIFLMLLSCCIIFFYYLLEKLKNKKKNLNTLLNVGYLLFLYMMNSLLRSIFSLIGYRNIQDNYWIYNNVAYNYKNNSHITVVLTCFLPIVICLGLILPIFFYWKLKQSSYLNNINSFKTIGFWLQSYSRNQEIWEFSKLFLAFCLNCIIIIDAKFLFRGVFAYLLLIIYVKVFQQNSVYYHKQMNKVENQLFTIALAILTTSLISPFSQNTVIFINSLYIIGVISIIRHFWIMNSKQICKLLVQKIELLNLCNYTLQKFEIFSQYSIESIVQRKNRFRLLKEFAFEKGRQKLMLKQIQEGVIINYKKNLN